jgi:methylisocitrate lyase
MNAAAVKALEAVRRDGTQKNVVDMLQTRAQTYEVLDYHSFEQKLDSLFAAGKKK